MDIQSLSNSAFAGITAQRPQTAPPEVANTSSQTAVTQRSDQKVPPTEAGQGASASRDQLNEAVKATNAFVNSFNNVLEFEVDDDSGKTVVRIIDSETKELVRQIPSEEMLAIAKALDTIKGLLIQQKA